MRRPESGPASSCQALSSPGSSRSPEDRERGGKLILVRDTAVDLAGALDLVAGRLVTRRQLLDDDKVAAPIRAEDPFVGKCDVLSTLIEMCCHAWLLCG